MKKKSLMKRALSAALAAAQGLALTVTMLPVQKAEAADFDLGSGFTDPTITVSTMYYWKEGLPPYVGYNGGKTEGSTIGVEYPVYITWTNDTFYLDLNSSAVYEMDYGEPNGTRKNASDRSYRVNHDDNDYNTNKIDRHLPAGYHAHWRTYFNNVSVFNTLDIAKSLRENGVAASMDVATNTYLVPTEDSNRYAIECGKGTNKWFISDLHFTQYARGERGYKQNVDWNLETRTYDKKSWVSSTHNVPVKEAVHTNVDPYSGYEQFDLRHRTWSFSRASDGQYSIGTDGTASWYMNNWASSSVDGWRNVSKDFVNGHIWDWTEAWLLHNYDWGYGGGAGTQSWGGHMDDWSHAQANQDSRYKFRVYYGEPNLVSFIQTDTLVQSGQVVNLDGPIVIGQNTTVTVEDGGVLVVSGWVMNGGYIMVKPGGMLIVQDQERLDGTKQYGVISCYQETPNKKYGRISCDGVMIVNRDCKVFGAGAYGIQFGEGAQCTNYGQLVSENFEVYGDHTIENRGDVSAVYAGWGLTGGGFVMANKKISMGRSFTGQGTIESASTVKMARDAVYGPGAGRVYINGDSKVRKQTGLDNRKGYVTDVESSALTYTPRLDSANGLYYIVDSQNYRYDWYDSLQGFARLTYANGTWSRSDFGGRYIFPSNSARPTRARGVAEYDPVRNNFYLRDGGTLYWYNAQKQGFLDENALTDVFYNGPARFPEGVTGAEITARAGSGGAETQDTSGPAPIVDGGTYYIQPALEEGKVLAKSTSFVMNRDMIVIEDKASPNILEQWTLRYQGSENGVPSYTIESTRDGRTYRLQVAGSYAGYGDHVEASEWVSRGEREAHWALTPDGDGYIISPVMGRDYALDVRDGTNVDTPIRLYPKNGGDSQRWKLVPVN